MQNFPDYTESDDTPQVQVGEEEQHLSQPLTHTIVKFTQFAANSRPQHS